VDGKFEVERTSCGGLAGWQKFNLCRIQGHQAAKAKHLPDPAYPENERKSGNEGRAFLHAVVDDKGNVRMPTVVSSPDPAFANAAIEAVKKWAFEPAKLSGEPVAVLITIEMEFRHF